MRTPNQKIPFGVKNSLVYFKNRLPTTEELESITPIVLTQGEMPWNPQDDMHNSSIDDDFAEELIKAAKEEERDDFDFLANQATIDVTASSSIANSQE